MGKRIEVRAGFSLIEVLVAFGILVSCLTLLAAVFTRHIEILQRIQRSLVAQNLSSQALAHRILEREHAAAFQDLLPEGFTVEEQTTPVQFQDKFLRGVELQQVTARASWSSRGKAYSESASTGLRAHSQESGT